jgi:phage N-6-adenine-methyltransferase
VDGSLWEGAGVSEALVRQSLTEQEARRITDQVKRDAEQLWQSLVLLYEGGAHLALGYPSWGDYFEAEFGGTKRRGYQLLEAGRVLESVQNFALKPRNDAQARELAPLLDQPERLQEAWTEVTELHPEPTAANVREVVQRKMGVHYSSATAEWSTPQSLFDELNKEFGFDLDVCATDENAKCGTWFTEREDGLAQKWTGTCWMNPPYGDEIKRWVQKAWESAEAGATVVCLVPARVDTGWWWDYCRYGEIRFLRGRLKFGGGDMSAPFPSAVVVFGRPAQVVWWESWRRG